jgi:hypothetical protein
LFTLNTGLLYGMYKVHKIDEVRIDHSGIMYKCSIAA